MCPANSDEDNRPVIREEVVAAIEVLKKGKSVRVGNIQTELVQAGSRRSHHGCHVV